jgi:hypothetical protein
MPFTPGGLPYPAASDIPDVPRDVQTLAEAIDAALGTTPSPRIARRKSANQALTAATTWYAVTFDVDTANGSGIAYANGVFTVAKGGVYQVNAQALMQGNAAAAVRLRVNIGSTDFGELVNTGTGGNASLVLARAIRLAAGATITIVAQSSLTGTVIAGSPSCYTFADITLIAP